MLLGTLAASLLANMVVGKPKMPGRGKTRTGEETTKAGEGVIRAVQVF